MTKERVNNKKRHGTGNVRWRRRIPSAPKQQVAHIHTSPSIHYQSFHAGQLHLVSTGDIMGNAVLRLKEPNVNNELTWRE